MRTREVRVVFDRRGPARRFTVQVVSQPPSISLAVPYVVPDDASDEQTALVVGGAVMRAALVADAADEAAFPEVP